MKRDLTVWISLAMIVVPCLAGLAMGMPNSISSDDPIVFQVFFWLIFLGSIRVTILWFQTLIHGVKYAKEENRVAVVLAHVILGPIISYPYYMSSRLDAKREENERQKASISNASEKAC